MAAGPLRSSGRPQRSQRGLSLEPEAAGAGGRRRRHSVVVALEQVGAGDELTRSLAVWGVLCSPALALVAQVRANSTSPMSTSSPAIPMNWPLVTGMASARTVER
ncbi:MAG: hypothetical protein WKF43_14840 [Acidimicrobiales bacterium]